MPRLPSSLLRHAYSIHRLLPLLLRECRDLPSAQNELRWLREYALTECRRHKNGGWHDRNRRGRPMDWQRHSNDNARFKSRLRGMVQQRARGVPLQYILGDQPFGELEILCRRGVLIPRPETESYTTRVANMLLSKFAPTNRNHNHNHKHKHVCKHSYIPTLRILDLCTGTGCIPLLLHSLLAPSFPRLQICGVDISTRALTLAWENLEHNIKLGRLRERARDEVSFVRGDVLSDLGTGGSMQASNGLRGEGMEGIFAPFSTTSAGVDHSGSSRNITSSEPSDDYTSGAFPIPYNPESKADTITILLSNPPYISPVQFTNGTTARSVRRYEPKLALVPPPAIHEADAGAAGCCAKDINASATITKTLKPTSKRQVLKINEMTATTRREDMFYPYILSMGLSRVDADIVVLECGEKGQAGRVAEMGRRVFGGLRDGEMAEVEVWRCDGAGDDGLGLGFEKSEDADDGGARAVIVRRGIFLDNGNTMYHV